MDFDCNPLPRIEENGLRWVWDYRQSVEASEKLRVFLRHQLSTVQREKILEKFSSQASEIIEEPMNSGLFAREMARFFHHPSRKLKIIGVTGTSGKTSTVTLINYLLKQLAYPSLGIGTLGLSTFDAKNSLTILGDTGFTSPDTPLLNSILSQAVKMKFHCVVMEVSSHALSLGRMLGIDFDIAVFNNLDRDHLDFHMTLENYRDAKKIFFTQLLKESKNNKSPFAVFNCDDWYGSQWAEEFQNDFNVLTFARNKNYKVLKESLEGLLLEFQSKNFSVPLLGAFNAENVMAALSVGSVVGELRADILEKFPGIPGRMELIKKDGKYFYVDYAHKPIALEKALEILKSLKSHDQKLWCVFGCGGNRDAGKRSIMGEIAARIADRVVITSDNPRMENPHDIINQILSGIAVDRLHIVDKIENRAEAIKTVFRRMSVNDICLIAGKGSENYQIVGENKNYFDDRECVRSLTNN